MSVCSVSSVWSFNMRWSGSFGQIEGKAKDCFRVGQSPSLMSYRPLIRAFPSIGFWTASPPFARREHGDRSANGGGRSRGRRLVCR